MASHTLYIGLHALPASANSADAQLYLELGLHGVSQSLVVEQGINVTDSADSDVLVPQLAVGKVHDISIGDGINLALDLARRHSHASSDELTANVLSDSGGAVERQENGSLELSLGALDLSLANISAETHPLPNGEVNEVVESSILVGAQVDTP